jgi:hypothetical protein
VPLTVDPPPPGAFNVRQEQTQGREDSENVAVWVPVEVTCFDSWPQLANARVVLPRLV